jgi:hypothetical protein
MEFVAFIGEREKLPPEPVILVPFSDTVIACPGVPAVTVKVSVPGAAVTGSDIA